MCDQHPVPGLVGRFNELIKVTHLKDTVQHTEFAEQVLTLLLLLVVFICLSLPRGRGWLQQCWRLVGQGQGCEGFISSQVFPWLFLLRPHLPVSVSSAPFLIRTPVLLGWGLP